MKKYMLASTLIISFVSNTSEHHYHTYYVPHTYAMPPYMMRQDRDYEKEHDDYGNTLLSALLVGTVSGVLCRQFEKIVLYDFFPFRLMNIVIWGFAQDRMLQSVVDDLKNQDIKHSPVAMKRLAWMISWISYIISS